MPGSFYPNWVAVRDKAYQQAYNQAHAEKRTAAQKEYAASHREEIKAYGENYYAKNHEKLKAQQKVYRIKNRKVLTEKIRAWRHATGEKDRTTTRARAQQVKQELVDMFGGCCSRCGFDGCLGALEFHHRDPAKKDFNIGGPYKRGIAFMKEEVLKCDLLCSNCHRMVHWRRNS